MCIRDSSKFNKKLALKNRISGQVLAADVVDPSTGEVIDEAGTCLLYTSRCV